jgi:alpha-1,3-glucosyltransferase
MSPPNAAFNAAAWIFSIATCIKLLLVPAYRSTDFEVHRHWLALTSSLPIRQWYLDTSSIWTLDYPPLFAHFSYLLSLPASLFDSAITSLSFDGSHTPGTVLYLRLTAALSDLSLFIATYRLVSTSRRSLFTVTLILWSPSLFIVDHVHFQYNGFLLGIFLLSLALLEEGRDLAGGFVFVVLLRSKHLFLVVAPFYYVYLLRHYCKGGFFRGFGRLVIMGMAVGAVFAVSFGPFLYYELVSFSAYDLLLIYSWLQLSGDYIYNRSVMAQI